MKTHVFVHGRHKESQECPRVPPRHCKGAPRCPQDAARMRHSGPTNSPAPSAQVGSRKLGQTRTRVGSPKQARVRISKPSKSQRCWHGSVSKRQQAQRCSSQISRDPRSSCVRSFNETSGLCSHHQNALPVLTSDRFVVKPIENHRFLEIKGPSNWSTWNRKACKTLVKPLVLLRSVDFPKEN